MTSTVATRCDPGVEAVTGTMMCPSRASMHGDLVAAEWPEQEERHEHERRGDDRPSERDPTGEHRVDTDSEEADGRDLYDDST